eukprot:COSAG05_NODE_18500_length_307_cov_1.115385_1_plen_90_part_10
MSVCMSVCMSVGATDASDAVKQAQPEKYLNKDGTQKKKWSVAGVFTTAACMCNLRQLMCIMYAGTEAMKRHKAAEPSAEGKAAGHATRHQ